MTELLNLLIQLTKDFQIIKDYILSLPPSRANALQAEWLDGTDTLKILKVSPRTLQSLRDAGVLPFSRINGKFYYKIGDIEKLLADNYSPAKSLSHGSN
jgi:hypothetical protein